MESFGVIGILIVLLVAAFFVFRPLVSGIIGKKGSIERTGKGLPGGIRTAALEAAALASLMLNYPRELLGYSSTAVLLALALGLVALPSVVAPVLAFTVVVVSITRMETPSALRLMMVLAAFLLLRFVFGGARHMLSKKK
ncbi:MAG: hypothetical protein PHQ19_10095 [Candidatus Krumholzibacteria bacterium]|nr:hypothetical protein [Candidatus Krumholzibacteria bacterium]